MDSIEEFIGLPYDEYDCFKLTRLVYKKINNLDLPEHFYSDPLDHFHVSQVVSLHKWRYKKVQKPKLGDIILLRVYGVPSHLGIYIDQNRFLHTQKQTGSIVDRLDKWEKRIVGFYRYDYHST